MIVVPDKNIRTGNLAFLYAYHLRLDKNENKVVYRHNEIANYSRLFSFDFIKDENMNNDKFSDSFFSEFLNFENCDFDALKNRIKWNMLSQFDNFLPKRPYICIVCRYGDYTQKINKDLGYKEFNSDILRKILQNNNELKTYDTIVVASDDINLAHKRNHSILKSTNKNIIYSRLTNYFCDLNLMMNASAIIGSCSTFSFFGFAINKNNSKLYVEYPYYNTWTQFKQLDGLYHHTNIIKYPNN